MFGSNKKKKIFVFLGHEDKEGTFCSQFADAYVKGAQAGGHEVRRVNIGDLKFDPLLHKGYKTIQDLEPDLKMVQDNFRWADHVVILYPTWWSAMPAILKGFFDRTWLPGFAFHMHKENMFWDQLLHGKTGLVVTTMDSWPFAERLLFGDSTNEIGKAILRFAGIKARIKKVGNLKHASENEKEGWREYFYDLGIRAK